MYNLSILLYLIVKFTIFENNSFMKNKFFKLNLLQLKSLSKLGLNVKQVYYSKTIKNKTYDLEDVIKEIEKQKQNIIANDNDNIDDFIDCKLIKPLTVLKYIYPHPTNVRTSIVCRVLNEEKCKLIVVERLDFIILQLKIFNSNMNY